MRLRLFLKRLARRLHLPYMGSRPLSRPATVIRFPPYALR